MNPAVRANWESSAVVALTLALPSAITLGEAGPSYEPFDPARIGLPALTEAGRDYLIEQHRRLIEEARQNIRELEQSELGNAPELIERYRQQILEEFRQIARLAAQRTQEAAATAQAGRVDDLPALRGSLTTVLEASRINALIGNEEEAANQLQAAVSVLRIFSAAFVTACYEQTFDPTVAIGLERQNEMLGTGIDVTGCAYRQFTADGATPTVTWRFKHCGLGFGEWRIETEGALQGSGIGKIEPNLSGEWIINESTPEGDIAVQYVGTLQIIDRAESNVQELAHPRLLSVHTSSGIVTADGRTFRRDVNIPGQTFAIKQGDRPCRSEEE